MRTPQQVQCRIAELEARLNLLEESMAEEMRKEYRRREILRLRFLYKEREVYRFALSQLQWVQQGE